MAKIPWIASINTGAGPTTANTTQYFLTGCGACTFAFSSESAVELLHRSPGTLSGLTIRLSANSVNATSTFTSRKNKADGNMIVSVGANATGHFTEGSPSSDTIAAGDKTTVKFVPGAASGTVTPTSFGTNFEATTDTVTRMQLYDLSVVNYSTASTTYYFTLGGAN